MLVYSDCFTTEEVISDSYRQDVPFEVDKFKEIAFEVASRRVRKGGDDFGISANVDEDAAEGATAENGEDAEMVIDIIDGFALEQATLSKADFKAYFKGYVGKLMKHLAAKKPDRVELFKEIIPGFILKVLEEWENVEFYFSRNYLDNYGDCEALPIIAYYKGEEVAPRFVFLRDGLSEEKC